MDTVYLKNIAIQAALSAGKIIRQSMDKDLKITKKETGTSIASQVVTEVDKACEAVIVTQLLPTCETFGIALLSEETEDDLSRLEKDFFWCIDPLDGTLAFINKRPGYSVSIALVAKDGTPQIGVVYDPVTDNVYHAIRDGGVYKNENDWEIQRKNNFLTYVTDQRLKDTPRVAEINKLLNEKVKVLDLDGIEEIHGGGSVLNAIRVLENGPACMLKFPKKENGGGSIWDFAATACIFEELGLPATNFSGDRLMLNQKETTFMNWQGVFYSNFDLE